jgi:hypothetical protein
MSEFMIALVMSLKEIFVAIYYSLIMIKDK